MKRSKLELYAANIQRASGCLVYLGVLIVTVPTSNLTFQLLERLVINHLYGSNAWAQGVHLINKQGDLSNGGSLAGWPSIIVHGGSFFLTALVFLGSCYLFGYIALRLKGGRLDDPPPKKKWSCNNPPRTARRD